MKYFYGFLAFMVIWIGFAAFVDYVVQPEARAWSMFWGFIAGTIGGHVMDAFRE